MQSRCIQVLRLHLLNEGVLYNRNLLAELLLVRKNFLFNLGMSKPNLGLDIPRLGMKKPKFGIDCFLNSFRFFS